ncbi:MAG TPA: cation-transporting P-type ATPase [Acidimicrobiales bacterium]|nr:cation-transporting P-type ATPase [Acidimicrobiales bacterium]
MTVAGGAPPTWTTAGLDDEEAARRLAADGPNVLPAEPPPSLAARVWAQLSEPLTLVLLVVAAITLAVLREVEEGAAIAAIVVLNVAIGVSQERRAEAAVDALKGLTAPSARVRRSGRSCSVPAAAVVRGDLVELAAGDRVPADVVLVEAASLAVDEAVLTGESLPAEKEAGRPAEPGAALADRPGEAFAGTLVVRGRGLGVVGATGAATRIGAIAAALEDETDPPLVTELRLVATRMSILAGALGCLLTLVVWLRHGGATEAVLAGVALAVAAVPEGLATIVTSALALGARRMAHRGAIVRRLPAMEALGSASVICTDKTGTLTTGHLAVADVVAVPGRDDGLWDAALRCNDADAGVGDPVDVALIEAAVAAGRSAPPGERVAERPFDTATRSHATVHRTASGPVLSVKGAPEAVAARCRRGPALDALVAAVRSLEPSGLRLLALATAPTGDPDAGDLEPLGVVAFHDPLRPSTAATIARCRGAGIRVALVTGDHLSTARAVAAEAGLDPAPAVTGRELAALGPAERAAALREASIVARVDPSTKVELVAAHRAAGDIVAMTGDGVNDAPALRQADIGVALSGSGGTDVAREAAGLVVTDGDLATLVAAVAEGRRIWRNLVSVVSYLLAGNISEVVVVLGCIALLPGLVVPLLPVQLLWVNFVTDGIPALALGVDRPPGDPLASPPRARSDQLLGWRRQTMLLVRGVGVAGAVLATGLLARSWGWSDEAVRTQLLLSLLFAHLMLAYVSRADTVTFGSGWWHNHVLLTAVAGSLALQLPAFATGPGRALLGLAAVPAAGWLLAAGAAAVTVLVVDASRLLARRRP